MFDRLWKKVAGEEVFSIRRPELGTASVYVWKRNGKYSLRISSDVGSYARGMAGNYTAVWFEPSQAQALIDALTEAKARVSQLLGKGN